MNDSPDAAVLFAAAEAVRDDRQMLVLVGPEGGSLSSYAAVTLHESQTCIDLHGDDRSTFLIEAALAVVTKLGDDGLTTVIDVLTNRLVSRREAEDLHARLAAAMASAAA